MDEIFCKLANSSGSQSKYSLLFFLSYSTGEFNLQLQLANSSGFEVDIFIDLSSRSRSGLNLKFIS